MSDDPLDQTNRLVISILCLIVIFAALMVVVLAWGATDGAIGRVDDFAGYLRDHRGDDARLIVSLVALVTLLLMLAIMIIELTPSPTQRMRIRDVKSGGATLTTRQIADRIDDEVMLTPHVSGCTAIVAARGKRVEIILDLQVDAGANLAHAANEACRRAHELVQDQMGISLAARPRARMHYRELRLKDEGTVHQAVPRTSTGWERPAGDEGAQ